MMKYKDTMTACDPHSLLRRMPPEEYINRLSDNMVKELCDTGKCGMMVEIVENIRDAYLYAQVKAIAYAACKLNDHLTAAVAQRDAGRMELQQARMDAARIRREAQLEAQNILANAEQERRKAMLLHNETVQREREQILEAARREAEAVREKLIEDARREAHEVYQELQGRFTPRAVSDAIEGYRREESAACAALAEQHRRKVNSFEETRTQLSSGMTGLQAQLMQQLSEMQSSISRSMMDWREQLYRLETMDLAQCAVNLSTILAGVDKRIGDAATQGDAAMVETLSSVRRNLARFEKQYRNALGAVGLEVYQPQPGEAFDPARHVLGDAEKDFDPDKPLTVTGCIRPGVLAGREALIRAEVNAKEAPAESATPKFSQIVPGGDQK